LLFLSSVQWFGTFVSFAVKQKRKKTLAGGRGRGSLPPKPNDFRPL
jgi:hypothetical protein